LFAIWAQRYTGKKFLRKFKKLFGKMPCAPIFALPKVLKTIAEVAQLVEHDLAKVGVASPSLVFRSLRDSKPNGLEFFFGNTSTRCCLAALVAELVDAQDLKSCMP
jgi:hypothetical protein